MLKFTNKCLDTQIDTRSDVQIDKILKFRNRYLDVQIDA